MPRRPRITLPSSIPTPTIPEAPIPRPRTRRMRTSDKARIKKVITRVKKRLRSADAEYYAVGKALGKLDRVKAVAAFGSSNFDAFLDEHVMGHGTAQRYMTVARHYSELAALRLGVEKAFQLVQYAAVFKTRLTAPQLAARDSRIGAGRRPVSTFSAMAIEDMVRMKKAGDKRAELPKATRTETRAAQAAARQVEEVLGVDARVRVDKKRDLVRLDIKLSDLLD